MEIGVYNGENAVSMIKAAIKNHLAAEVDYYGFDFFHNYSTERIKGKLEATGCNVTLFKGDTMDTVPEATKLLPTMDIIFIDGGKSFKEAWSDWKGSSKLMHDGTGVFVHNVGFSGVGRMVENIPRDIYNVKVWYTRSEGRVALIKRKN